MLDRRFLLYFDWLSLALIIILSSLSLCFVYSATYKPDVAYSIYFYKQLFGILSGFVIYFMCCAIDYRTLQRWGYFCYIGLIGLLIITLVKGSIGMGAQRWINLGLFKFQPSELAKLFFPAFFSYYLFTEKEFKPYLSTFMPIVSIVGCSTLLIIKQPDLGTGLLILFSASAMIWLSGIAKQIVFSTCLLLCISTPFVVKTLKPYQKKRIAVFLGEGDSKRERYHIEQSKIAIGSGGLLGKGFLQGTQTRLQFLPESRTDFIFSVIGEELGFIGAFIIILLYIILFGRCLMLTTTINNFYAQLLAIGLVIQSLISTIVNIGMVIGLLPVVGIPLPFMSYGVSHLWITFASFGWFNGIIMRRFYMNKGH